MINQSNWSVVNSAPSCHLTGVRLDTVHRAERTGPWGGLMLSALWLFPVFNIPPTLCPHPEWGHSFPPLPRWRWTLTCPHATPQPAFLFHRLSFLVSRLSQALTFPVACHYSFTPALCFVFYGVRDEMSEHTEKQSRGVLRDGFSQMWKLKPPLGRFHWFKYLMGACGSVVTQQALTWHEHAWKCSLVTSAELCWQFPEQFQGHTGALSVWSLFILIFDILNCLLALYIWHHFFNYPYYLYSTAEVISKYQFFMHLLIEWPLYIIDCRQTHCKWPWLFSFFFCSWS